MTDTFEDETEQSVTIDEYLNKLESDELEADLVLGGDEGKECTYNMGYMKRQAIFSCLTCTPDGNAGVCTACSLSCHDGHEIVELWTKRNFCCDCGNSKFGSSFCKLLPAKDGDNVKNSYNHNFKGLYCTCGRPYPDPDAEEQEEMIQCIICEDWFHEEHLGLEASSEIPKDEEGEPVYEDFICKACVGICSFLALYPRTIRAHGRQVGGAASNPGKDKHMIGKAPLVGESVKHTDNVGSDGSSEKNGDAGSIEEAPGTGEGSENNIKDANNHVACSLDLNTVPSSDLENKPLFLCKGWRDILCRCEKCFELYKQKRVNYLLDKEDSIAEYEKIAKQKREEKLQRREGAELNFLEGLGHVEKIEMLSALADFKDEFTSFLENFDSSKPVTASDIRQIFENLSKKRRRME